MSAITVKHSCLALKSQKNIRLQKFMSTTVLLVTLFA